MTPLMSYGHLCAAMVSVAKVAGKVGTRFGQAPRRAAHRIKRQETPRPLWRRGRMELVTEVLSALIPPVVVGGAFIFGVVKLVRAEGPRRHPNRQDQAEKSN